ncbi:MAG: 3-deoxy-8-phosphooctulonate synthase [Flavobacteriales bacterium]|nr:3-deoxy-8-phosphooctulonate synthase [Flavobacteriales bacterium]
MNSHSDPEEHWTAQSAEVNGWTAGNRLQIIAGPCAIESEALAMQVAEEVGNICSKLDLPFIFKGSYRKANRSRLDSFTGIGDQKALGILQRVGEKMGVRTTTDIHAADEAAMAAAHVDVLQIPAFLCRQTDLLVAAAQTGKVVNIKKGQFLAPQSMVFAAQKVRESGNQQIWLTERGTMMGYQDMVVDMRSFPAMRNYGPVIADITHSLQQPNQSGGVTGGRPELIATIGKAAVAAGADGIFIETHPDPASALSDGANMLPLDQLEALLVRLKRVHEAVRD